MLFESNDDFEVVGVVDDGDRVLETTNSLHPDVLVLDIVLPGMSGLELVTAMRQLPTKILIFSGQASALEFHRAIQAGAAGAVSKSDQPECVFDAIHSIVSGRTYVSPHVSQLLAPLEGDGKDHSRLTGRERQILTLIAEGLSSHQIADRLNIALRTVRKHRENIMGKLGVSNAVEATRIAAQMGLTRLS